MKTYRSEISNEKRMDNRKSKKKGFWWSRISGDRWIRAKGELGLNWEIGGGIVDGRWMDCFKS